MGWLERLQTVILMGSILVGLGIGQVEGLANGAERLILPFLLVLLIGVFVQVPLKDVRKALLNIRLFTAASVGINFVVTPVAAAGIGFLFLRDMPELWIGLVMLMVTPCTDWYLVFTSLARGNMALSTAILPLNLILQIVLLPVYLWFLTGESHQVEPGALWESVVAVLVIPLIVSRLIRWGLFRHSGKSGLKEKVVNGINAIPLVFLNLTIAAMFASQGTVLLQHPSLLWELLLPILVMFLLLFVIGRVVARLLHFSYPDRVSLHFTTLARNSPVALAIALTAFSGQPLIALALVIGPLIELPVLFLFSRLFLHFRNGNN
ncbi:arsenic resistance protein [Fischerella thermalis CCMEE 5273]|nr:arsenic resistance protein [Fischerella thermalis CCMEE 5273]